jgi:4-hydroxybenzoate polyprenyltransferase
MQESKTLRSTLTLFRLFNSLSVDVVAGALCSSLFFSSVLAIYPTWEALCALGLTVWIIYTFDHLLDVSKPPPSIRTARHQLHQKFFRIFVVSIGIAAALLIFLLLLIDAETIKAGLWGGLFLLTYFLLKRYGIIKEVLIAGGYTMGVLLPSLVSISSLTTDQVLIIICFFLIVFYNVVLFALFDDTPDRLAGHVSIVHLIGNKKTQYLLTVLFVGSSGIALFLLVKGYFTYAGILLLMSCLLFVIQQNKCYFETYDRFRVVGDAIFILPVLVQVV